MNEHFSGYEAETDSDGRFVLKNLPPGREFSLYTLMRSMGDRGALPRKVYTSQSSGTIQDFGNIEVEPAFKLAGRIVFSDGHKLPKGQKISLSREDAWDNTETELDSDGKFEFKGVPAECIGLWFRTEGYKFSTKNPSLDWLNGRILGRMTPETGYIDLLMEPGKWRYREEGSPPDGRPEYPREVPLTGVKLEKK